MENLALSALHLAVNLVHYSVYRYQIVYQKFVATASGERFARKAAFEDEKPEKVFFRISSVKTRTRRPQPDVIPERLLLLVK